MISQYFFFLLNHCKFMCCSQHFTTYLLSLQNILFFDWRRASYIILLICMLACNSIVFSSPPNDISMLPFLKTERLPRIHIPIDFINENTIFLRIHVIVILYLGFIFLQIVLQGVYTISYIHDSFLLLLTLPEL